MIQELTSQGNCQKVKEVCQQVKEICQKVKEVCQEVKESSPRIAFADLQLIPNIVKY